MSASTIDHQSPVPTLVKCQIIEIISRYESKLLKKFIPTHPKLNNMTVQYSRKY